MGLCAHCVCVWHPSRRPSFDTVPNPCHWMFNRAGVGLRILVGSILLGRANKSCRQVGTESALDVRIPSGAGLLQVSWACLLHCLFARLLAGHPRLLRACCPLLVFSFWPSLSLPPSCFYLVTAVLLRAVYSTAGRCLHLPSEKKRDEYIYIYIYIYMLRHTIINPVRHGLFGLSRVASFQSHSISYVYECTGVHMFICNTFCSDFLAQFDV
jgi:hypothetical protein